MSAVGLLARNELRRRWRSGLVVVLLIGIVGTIVLATAAGARRSDTALDRFNAASRSSDLEISVGMPTASQIASFRRTRGIAAIARLRGFAFALQLEDLAIAAPLDAAIGNRVDRSRLVAGRRADPTAPDEIVIGESLAGRLHLGVGSRFPLSTFTPAQVTRALSGGGPEAPGGPHVTLRVVGIDRRPLDLGVRAASGGVVVLTPAFHRAFGGRIGAFTDVLRVKTVHGRADVPHVVDAARAIFGNAQTFGTQGVGIETEGPRSAIDVLTLALWIVTAIAAFAGLVAIGIVLTRDITSAEVEQATLRALGLTRRERAAANLPRAALVAAAGALLAALGSVALSPLFPTGVARRADPNPGLHADWTVLALAIPAVAVIVMSIALLASWRSARSASFDPSPSTYPATSEVLRLAADAGLRPVATNGLRMAIQRGRGAGAVPVRSAFAGAAFGIAGVTAALVFGSSLAHLVATPRLSGWAWDVSVEVPSRQVCRDAADHGVRRVPRVSAVALVCAADIEVDGRPVSARGFRNLRGDIGPVVVAGRAPRRANEVALGSETLHALHKQIGDTVRVHGDERTARYHVVGRVVVPPIGELQPMADGATFTSAGLLPLRDTGSNETDYRLLQFAPGTDLHAARERVAALPRVKNALLASTPIEVSRLEQIDRVPVALAILLGVLAAIAVAHALVTGVHRRRRELALLKTLGFSRGQVGATVAWQATTLGVVGLVVGIPLGVVVGRVAWQLVADSLGIAAEITTPVAALAVLVPATLVLVNLVAFVPARAAARTRPAVALRSS